MNDAWEHKRRDVEASSTWANPGFVELGQFGWQTSNRKDLNT